MPPPQYQNGANDGCKFQRPKKRLASTQITIESSCRLCHAKNCTQIDQNTAGDKRPAELHEPAVAGTGHNFSCPQEKQAKENEEDEKGDTLEYKPAEQDIIWRSRILAITLRGTNEPGASNLGYSSNDITYDEDGKDSPPAEA